MKIRILPLMWLSLACVELPAGAVQTQEVRDGATIEAVISAREPTRIRIEGEKIVDECVEELVSHGFCRHMGHALIAISKMSREQE